MPRKEIEQKGLPSREANEERCGAGGKVSHQRSQALFVSCIGESGVFSPTKPPSIWKSMYVVYNDAYSYRFKLIRQLLRSHEIRRGPGCRPSFVVLLLMFAFVYRCWCLYVYIYIYIYVYIHVTMRICIYIYIYMYYNMYIYIYIYMCVYIIFVPDCRRRRGGGGRAPRGPAQQFTKAAPNETSTTTTTTNNNNNNKYYMIYHSYILYTMYYI